MPQVLHTTVKRGYKFINLLKKNIHQKYFNMILVGYFRGSKDFLTHKHSHGGF